MKALTRLLSYYISTNWYDIFKTIAEVVAYLEFISWREWASKAKIWCRIIPVSPTQAM